MSSGAKGAEIFFLTIKNGPIFFTKCMANGDFSETPRRTDSKDPIFFFFAIFWARVTSEAQGSVSVGFGGSHQIEPLFGGWGVLARGLHRPPPPLS